MRRGVRLAGGELFGVVLTKTGPLAYEQTKTASHGYPANTNLSRNQLLDQLWTVTTETKFFAVSDEWLAARKLSMSGWSRGAQAAQ